MFVPSKTSWLFYFIYEMLKFVFRRDIFKPFRRLQVVESLKVLKNEFILPMMVFLISSSNLYFNASYNTS